MTSRARRFLAAGFTLSAVLLSAATGVAAEREADQARAYNHFLAVLEGSEEATAGDPVGRFAADVRDAWVRGRAEGGPLPEDPAQADLRSVLYPGVVEETGHALLLGKNDDPDGPRLSITTCKSCGGASPELLALVAAAREGDLREHREQEAEGASLRAGGAMLLALMVGGVLWAGPDLRRLRPRRRTVRGPVVATLHAEVRASRRRLAALEALPSTPLVDALVEQERALLDQLRAVPHLVLLQRAEAEALSIAASRPDPAALRAAQEGADADVRAAGGTL